MKRSLPMWVIYKSPSDFPGKFVVRRWLAVSGDGCGTMASPSPVAVVGSLKEARDALPLLGLVNVGREPGDDPVIVETWL